MPKTMFEKIWEQHEVVGESTDAPAILYVDLRLIHEVSAPSHRSEHAVVGRRRPLFIWHPLGRGERSHCFQQLPPSLPLYLDNPTRMFAAMPSISVPAAVCAMVKRIFVPGVMRALLPKEEACVLYLLELFVPKYQLR